MIFLVVHRLQRLFLVCYDRIVDQLLIHHVLFQGGYNVGEVLQFRRNGASSDVANLVPGRSSYCHLIFSLLFFHIFRFEWILY